MRTYPCVYSMGIEVRDIVMKRRIFYGMSTNSSCATRRGEATAVRAVFWRLHFNCGFGL